MVKLLIDENLLRLARWCRFLGFDVLSPSAWRDDVVSSRACAEGRILVTRDRELTAAHAGPSLRISSDDFGEQLHAVLKRYGATEESRWFTRCAECNEELRLLSPEERQAHPLVPPNWREADCWECRACGRAYWHGSHYARTRAVLREAVANAHA